MYLQFENVSGRLAERKKRKKALKLFVKAAFQDSSFCGNYTTLITAQNKIKLHNKFGHPPIRHYFWANNPSSHLKVLITELYTAVTHSVSILVLLYLHEMLHIRSIYSK